MSARRIVLALAAFAVVALAGPVPAAQAHAFLASSNPADGQVLASAPAELRLAFSESVVLSATRIDIVDGTGRDIVPTSVALVNAGNAEGTEKPVEIVASLPALGRSSYRISWETLSSDDLHATRGTLVFGVGESVTAGGLSEPAPSPAEAGLRWVILLGLAGALGGALAGHLLARAAGPGVGRGALLARRAAVVGPLAAALAAAVLLFSQLAAGGAGAGSLLWGSYGVRWGVRELGLILLVCAATVRRRNGRPSAGRLLLVAGAALACAGTALLGHSGAGAALNVTRVIASAAHLGAAMTWAGCLAILAFVLVTQVRREPSDRVDARAVLQRFWAPASACVAVMVVTGVYLASEFVGSVDAALFTLYGRTLLLKLALAGTVGILALVNTVRLHRHRGSSTPQRTVVAEALVAVGILCLAAVLTSGQPAMEPQLVRQPSVASSSFVDRRVADLQETVAVAPNRPGSNVVMVDVFNTRRPAPAPISAVEVALVGADGVVGPRLAAEPLPNGRWSASTNLDASGPVTVQVTVLRRGMADTTSAYRWTVDGLPDQVRAAVVSTAPIRSVLQATALVLLVLLLVGGLLVLTIGPGGRWRAIVIRRYSGPRRAADAKPAPEELASGRASDRASGAKLREPSAL